MLGFILATSIIALEGNVRLAQDQNQDNKVAEAKQAYERLRRADFAKLEIARVPLELKQNEEDLAKPFKTGAVMRFRLLVTNTSNDSVGVPLGDERKQLRPLLLRDGDEVHYRKSVAELLVSRQSPFHSSMGASLAPSHTVTIYIDLKDWYGPLKHGHYQLTVKMRFIPDGNWVESSSLIFDVEPDPTN